MCGRQFAGRVAPCNIASAPIWSRGEPSVVTDVAQSALRLINSCSE